MTTQQLHRELSGLRDLLEARLDAVTGSVSANTAHVGSMPDTINSHLDRFQELQSEKFASIQKQFNERDVRASSAEIAQKEAAAALATSSNTAVNAALQAQKEAAAAQNQANTAAITKSEIATGKEIDGIKALLANNTKSIDDKLTSINARLDRSEGKTTGFTSNLATGLAATAVAVSLLAATGVFKGGNAGPTISSVPLAIPAIPGLPGR